ncbi:hypothetical protein L228DRAFT_149814 [Xylona heveae TC161]|uniref:Mitochondrial import inner membrane translocase subunit TIM54 n=1 Tax=Xylona heveae (strain CBS 132557 / TC161) TaxID=1328760 RepID=A0A165GK00_XYLHT|nr:hypothetical protein L228DRAFT_149814 [Xylona heveae TC161]KZF22286.1 hypothetical protein L228DRAFT_149814 [Xylona heveae TC161]
MAESQPPNAPAPPPAGDAGQAAGSAAKAAPKAEGNPALRAMGLPSRFKLPSRNWMIFLTLSSTFAGFLIYDRYEKKKIQKKWCTLVSHIADESLPTSTMPRKLTVFLSAPPGDGLRPARDHFNEYVKPILVAAAMDWDVIEGRREGEVRTKLAEKVRRLRQIRGEVAENPTEPDSELLVQATRQTTGIQEWDGVKGDLVLGRHTWKEYLRGLQEGWLGPLDAPVVPTAETASSSPTPADSPATDDASPTAAPTSTSESESTTPTANDDANKSEAPLEPQQEQPQQQDQQPEDAASKSKTKPPAVLTPYISPSSYASAPLPPSFPAELDPSGPIPFPHILGILNTPTRVYRFLTRRHLADQIGRETAAVVFAASRAYKEDVPTSPSSESSGPSSSSSETSASSDNSPSASSPATSTDAYATATTSSPYTWEQKSLLAHEEKEWHKSAHKRAENEGERPWLESIVLDDRIATRMRRFELEQDQEQRANRIAEGKEGVLGAEVSD